MTPSSYAIALKNTRVSSPAAAPAKELRVPRHLAIVMDESTLDCNPAVAVHALHETIQNARENGVGWLSLFIPPRADAGAAAPAALYQALAEYVQENMDALAQQGIRLGLLSSMFPQAIKDPSAPAACRATQALLAALKQAAAHSMPDELLTVTLAVNYSGRADLIGAIRRLAQEAASGSLQPSQLGPQDLARSLCLRGMPPVDLLVRTGDETSLSDFLLWQSAYTELLFVTTPWPEFRQPEFRSALIDYSRRQRTFGALPQR